MNTPAKSSQAKEVNLADLPITNPEGVKSVYCNNISFALTNWDVRMMCTEIQPAANPSEGPTQVLRANIVMSVTHAQALLEALKRTLDQHAETQQQQAKVSAGSAKKQ